MATNDVPATMYRGAGVGYAGDRDAIIAALDEYRASSDLPPDLEARTVAASRKIDSLRFKTDEEDRMEYQRFNVANPPAKPDPDMVPGRIAHAVALIAIALPSDAAPVPLPERQPSEVVAGGAGVKWGTSTEDLQPAKSDDQLLAERLGIPDVRAFRLLKPYLVLPDTLNQDSRERGPGVNVNIEFSPDFYINQSDLA